MNLRNKKAKSTPETVAEAQALSKLWKSRPHPSQAVFGETFEIGNQSAVGQFLRGDIPLSPKAAFGFAKGLGCAVADFSPRLAKMFPVSRIALEDALQCFASHLQLLDAEDRTTAAFLTDRMIQQTEKTDIYKSMLAQLLYPSTIEIKAELASRLSSAEAAKFEIPPRPSPAETGKAALLLSQSSAEAAKAELLSRLSSAEAAKLEIPPRPSPAEAGKAALLLSQSSAEAAKAELLSRLSSAEAAMAELRSNLAHAEAAKAESQLTTALAEAAKKTS